MEYLVTIKTADNEWTAKFKSLKNALEFIKTYIGMAETSFTIKKHNIALLEGKTHQLGERRK